MLFLGVTELWNNVCSSLLSLHFFMEKFKMVATLSFSLKAKGYTKPFLSFFSLSLFFLFFFFPIGVSQDLAQLEYDHFWSILVIIIHQKWQLLDLISLFYLHPVSIMFHTVMLASVRWIQIINSIKTRHIWASKQNWCPPCLVPEMLLQHPGHCVKHAWLNVGTPRLRLMGGRKWHTLTSLPDLA